MTGHPHTRARTWPRWLQAVIGAGLALATACGGASATSPSSNSTSTTTVTTTTTTTTTGSVALTSAAWTDGGTLPAKYICKARTGLNVETNPPLDWTTAPAGTVVFVVLMSTVAKDATGTTTKYNWVLYDIPATARAIAENNTVIVSGNTGTTLIGTPGLTSDGPQFSYSPPCSAVGSGLRTYTFTLYALSARPVFAFNHDPGAGGDGANLAAAVGPLTLARTAISGSYVF